jgi:hypothetical protein
MHVNNYTLPRPTDEALDKCHQILIGDPVVPMWRMKKWCYENNLSLVWYELVETADVSPTVDAVAGFWFIDGRDATLFSLKYK